MPIVRASSAATAPATVTEAEANRVQQELYKARERKKELEASLKCLKPLVADKKLTRESVKELVDTYLRQAADFDNFQQRVERDMASSAESSAASVLESLYKVLAPQRSSLNPKPSTIGGRMCLRASTMS